MELLDKAANLFLIGIGMITVFLVIKWSVFGIHDLLISAYWRVRSYVLNEPWEDWQGDDD